MGQEDKSLCGECFSQWSVIILQAGCTILCCVPLQDVGAGQIHHIQKPIEAWSTATVSLAHARQGKGRGKMFYL